VAPSDAEVLTEATVTQVLWNWLRQTLKEAAACLPDMGTADPTAAAHLLDVAVQCIAQDAALSQRLRHLVDRLRLPHPAGVMRDLDVHYREPFARLCEAILEEKDLLASQSVAPNTLVRIIAGLVYMSLLLAMGAEAAARPDAYGGDDEGEYDDDEEEGDDYDDDEVGYAASFADSTGR